MRIASLILILTAVASMAAPAPFPVTIDSRFPAAPGLTAYRGNQTAFRVSFVDGGTASDLTGCTPFLQWSTGTTAAAVSTSTWSTVSTGVVDFTFSPAGLNYAPGRYVYEAGILTSNGTPRTYRQGSFTIIGSPVGQGVAAVNWTTNVNWAAINWSNLPNFGNATDLTARASALAASNLASSATNWIATNTVLSTATGYTDSRFSSYVPTDTLARSSASSGLVASAAALAGVLAVSGRVDGLENSMVTGAVVRVESDPVFLAWTNLPYFVAGEGATVSAFPSHSVSLGKSASAIGIFSIAIGDADAGNTAIAIGDGASALGDDAVGIGDLANGSGTNSVAIGHGSEALGDRSIAIGRLAAVRDADTIQLGSGLNATPGSFQVWDYTMMDSSGFIPFERFASSAYTPALDSLQWADASTNGFIRAFPTGLFSGYPWQAGYSQYTNSQQSRDYVASFPAPPFAGARLTALRFLYWADNPADSIVVRTYLPGAANAFLTNTLTFASGGVLTETEATELDIAATPGFVMKATIKVTAETSAGSWTALPRVEATWAK